MNVLDLFSGIGGFSLGLERAGMRTVAFCEIDPYCRRVLGKHWPSVPIYDDVRSLTAERLATDGVAVDAICGGFPCQDISVAGKGAGIEGERSGLWSEYARIIGEVRPQFVIVENVAALLNRGLDKVLGDLAALGFDAEWHCIPASAVGAPHRRDRLWLVAYPEGHLRRTLWNEIAVALDGTGDYVADAESSNGGRLRCDDASMPELDCEERLQIPTRGRRRAATANSDRPRLEVGIKSTLGTATWYAQPERQDCLGRQWWSAEPDVGRVAHGVPNRVDRLRALGNAVVPQIPEIIGRAIMSAMTHKSPENG